MGRVHNPPFGTAAIAASAARVTGPVFQLINTGVLVALTFDTVVFDTNFFFNIATPTRLTVPSTGKYYIGGSAAWVVSNNNDIRRLRIRVNGGADLAIVQDDPEGGISPLQQTLSTMTELFIGDFVELIASQDSGAQQQIDPIGFYIASFGQ